MSRGNRIPLRGSLALLPVLLACTPSGATTNPAGDRPMHVIDDTSATSASTNAQVESPLTLLRGAKVMTATGTTYERGDVLMHNGRIVAVGPKLDTPAGATVMNLRGKVVTPGIIDTHSHMGVYASPGLRAHSDGNEAVAPVTAYARAAEGFWPQDPQIDKARAGGVTTIQVLPGSANLIGGRSVTLKLYPDARSVGDMRFAGAPEGLKMACGENPKRVYGEKGGPQTRMGNVAGYRAAFQQALEYKQQHEQFELQAAMPPSEEDADAPPPLPPPRDYALETLAKVIDGEILVHNHCYRADEMTLMMGLAKDFGFKIRSFHHAVEAYKIADRLAAEGTSVSIWADWWGFKAEAYDGVRENAAIVSAVGGMPIIHSDSPVGIQRLNQEAAKAMYAGREAGIQISENEALRWITYNAAWALGIHDQTGTLEAGKMADIVVWSANPFSVYAKAEQVYIDGKLTYDIANAQAQPRTDFDLGHRDADWGIQ